MQPDAIAATKSETPNNDSNLVFKISPSLDPSASAELVASCRGREGKVSLL
jgi:hypothetical protein